jgi:PmbA protein
LRPNLNLSMAQENSKSSIADSGFAYSSAQFQQLIEDVLSQARALGASDAGAEVSEGCGLSVSVRKGELENVERNRDKSLGISVYVGQRRGNASTSDFSKQALSDTVRAAFDIARFTAEDPVAGLPDEQDLSLDVAARPALDLFHPWAVDAATAAALALRCEVTSASPTPRARACRLSNRIFSRAIAGDSVAAMPARVTRFRWRRLRAVVRACSATPGIRPCARLRIWPNLRR